MGVDPGLDFDILIHLVFGQDPEDKQRAAGYDDGQRDSPDHDALLEGEVVPVDFLLLEVDQDQDVLDRPQEVDDQDVEFEGVVVAETIHDRAQFVALQPRVHLDLEDLVGTLEVLQDHARGVHVDVLEELVFGRLGQEETLRRVHELADDRLVVSAYDFDAGGDRVHEAQDDLLLLLFLGKHHHSVLVSSGFVLEKLLVDFALELDVVQQEVELRRYPESQVARKTLVPNVGLFKLVYTADDFLLGVFLNQVVLYEVCLDFFLGVSLPRFVADLERATVIDRSLQPFLEDGVAFKLQVLNELEDLVEKFAGWDDLGHFEDDLRAQAFGEEEQAVGYLVDQKVVVMV